MATLIVAATCVFLGRWQYHRYQTKSTAEHHLEANYNGVPVALRSVLPSAAAVPDRTTQWRQVAVTGNYDPNHHILIRNRPLDGTYGYEVVVPLTYPGGVVFVDRGWIANGRTAVAPDSIPPTPTGQVTVVGWVRAGEPNLDRAPVAGQAASINIPELRTLTGQPQADSGFVLMRREAGNNLPTTKPDQLPKPDPGSYAWINFSYAYQWWLAALAIPAFFLVRLRRQHLEDTGRAKPKEKKVRIWDEEDE
ncbi:SURF1 family protein [Calidifontibacter terrae]